MSLLTALSPTLRDDLDASGALARMKTPDRQLLRPLMLICETINVCNARCVFCAYNIQTRARGLMEESLFAEVVRQYEAMGGGCFSLTPMVGDVLLDRKLPSRLHELARHRERMRPSFTTNLYALDRWSDDDVFLMLDTMDLIHVSCYGLDAEECTQITRRDHFATFNVQMRRLLELRDRRGSPTRLSVGFRLIHDRPPEELEEYQRRSFGRVLPVSSVFTVYRNWGNSLAGELPGEGSYARSTDNQTPCALLAVALMIFWDGRVSACSCCDYDASDQLVLGDLGRETLLGIFNNPVNQALWRSHQMGDLPPICRNCTFHVPLADLTPEHPLLRDIQQFIGG